MVVGNQEMKKEEREEQLRDKADRKRKNNLSVGLKPSTPTKEVRLRKTSSTTTNGGDGGGSDNYTRANTPPVTSSTRDVTSQIQLSRRRSRTFTQGFLSYLDFSYFRVLVNWV